MMKKVLRVSVFLLLLFNGIGAIYGGLNFIFHPNGSSMQMSLDLLKRSPFHDYLIPGIILLIANGLFSFVAFAALFFRLQSACWFVMAQGVILCGWIFIQVLLLQVVIPLHLILGSVGIALIILGWLLRNATKSRVKTE